MADNLSGVTVPRTPTPLNLKLKIHTSSLNPKSRICLNAKTTKSKHAPNTQPNSLELRVLSAVAEQRRFSGYDNS
eukprot:6324660-Amphidinium_carterae.1